MATRLVCVTNPLLSSYRAYSQVCVASGAACGRADPRDQERPARLVRADFSSVRRIRLAAYGARLERVLGSRPRGFKSHILREKPLLTQGFSATSAAQQEPLNWAAKHGPAP